MNMKKKSIEAKIINNFNDKNPKFFTNTSNITGLPLEVHFYKKIKVKGLDNFTPLESRDNIGSNIYQSLSKKEKIKYIKTIINNSSTPKEQYDCLAVKRKKYSLGYLIRQFDLIEQSKSFEENRICKSPYPLIYCISNRKVGNDSSNLLAKILTSENKQLSKKQENVIKYSSYSKMFNTDISNLIKTKRSKRNLSKKNHNNLSKNYSYKKFPFLNKYIKSKVNNYKYGNLNRNDYYSLYSNSVGFFPQSKNKKLNNKNNIKRWNSTFSMNINGKENMTPNNIKNRQLNNIVESFINKKVCLENHKNNIINNSIIKERRNKIIDEIFYRKRNYKSDPSFDEIIKDASHLKFNNQIIPFNNKIKEL